MKQNKCPFCAIPCEEEHCAWTPESEPDPKPDKKTNNDKED